MASLKAHTDKWQVDMPVAGTSLDCVGQTFGRLQFLRDTVKNRFVRPDENSEGGKVTLVFVRVCVDAIDIESALHAAIPIADQHLSVLNALFSDWQPSRFYLYRGELDRPFIRNSMSRAVKVGDSNTRTKFESQTVGMPLSRTDWDGLLKLRKGAALGGLLMRSDAFANRVIAGYVTAGTACVEPKPQLAFLLFAIALESAVLGNQTKSEITYQLSTRVAHLLASTIDVKRSVVEQVSAIYELRSHIVHSGENEVSETDLYRVRAICLRSLWALATSSDFVNMRCVKELDQWFNNRMLSGSGGSE